MSINACNYRMAHIELFGKPALLSYDKLDRSTVPEGWYCYDLRGTDCEPHRPVTLEDNVELNFRGSVLSPAPLKKRLTISRRLNRSLHSLDGSMNIQEFCEAHGLTPPATPKYIPRPARFDEAGLFYSQSPEQETELGTIGHVRMDFGSQGKEFWTTWWPHGEEVLNTPEFKAELDDVVNTLRANGPLRSLAAMTRFCCEHEEGTLDAASGDGVYGYVVETEHYQYFLRCTPTPGEYQGYLYCYDKRAQELNMANKQLIGRLTFANGEKQEFTDAADYLNAIREELSCNGIMGFTCETLTDDPVLRKAADDILIGEFGEVNPRPLEDYEQPKTEPPTMTMGGMNLE